MVASGSPDILTEESIVREASLHLPMVARPFLLVPQLKLEKLPKTDGEAAQIITDLLMGKRKGKLD